MAERSEAVEEQAVRDGAAAYSVETEIATDEDVPPGYKRTEVGMIPEDWGMAPIRDLGTVVTGSTPPTSDVSNYGDYLPFATPADIGEAKYIRSTLRRLSRRGAALARRFPIDSILFVSIGSTIGKCGMAPTELTSNQQINAVLPGDRCHPDYFYYAISLASDRVKDWAGTQAVPIVNKSQFSETLLPLPYYEEQRAIATALSDADALIESLDRLIAKKRAIKQAAMQQLLTGQTRLPGFEGEWETKYLGEIAELHRRGVTPATFPDVPFQHFSLPAFDESQAPTIDLGMTIGSNKFRVPQKAVLVSKLNPRIPRVWKPESIGCNAIASTEFLLFTPREGISRDFLYVLCCSPRFTEQMELLVTGTTGSHQRISPASALKIEVILPSSAGEQAAIATILSDMGTEVATLERRRDKARQIKQGMMQQLLTGRVRLVRPESAA